MASLTEAATFWKMLTRSAVPSVDLIQTSLLPTPPENGLYWSNADSGFRRST